MDELAEVTRRLTVHINEPDGPIKFVNRTVDVDVRRIVEVVLWEFMLVTLERLPSSGT
jgi:hypothetical protein